MNPIYLDANATTPLLPEVADAMRAAEVEGFGNPASSHFAGRQARRLVENARETIATIVGARVGGRDEDRVIFTSGGTEANNLALHGLMNASRRPQARLGENACIISSIEHPSVSRVADQLENAGCHVARLLATPGGSVQPAELQRRITPATRLVSVLHANHETGVVQPIREMASFCAAAQIPMHTDASQTVGKIAVDFRDLNVAALTLSAHKFHGPKGIGALVVRHGALLHPLHFGGYQQAGLRAGTEPVALIVGMGRALELFHAEQNARIARISRLRDRFQHTITAGWPNAVAMGAESPRIPHAVALAFGGIDRQALVMALDQAGIACSSGSACASGSMEPSPTLVAMGYPPDMVACAVRFSLSAVTSSAEVDDAARRILRVCHQLGRRRKD